MQYRQEPVYVHNSSHRLGIILVNLGTPAATDYRSMRRYLKQFLSDPRVVDKNRALWLSLLNGLLLQIIPFKSGRNYDKIWNTEANESPLLTITRDQASTLQQRLKTRFGGKVRTTFAMCYGQPDMQQAIDELKAANCHEIIMLPLYPQYSAVTTGAAYDAFFKVLQRTRYIPAFRAGHAYHDHPAYIEALARSVRNHLNTLDWTPEMILMSYHGVPVRYHKNGDPYPCHCWKTSRLLSKALGLNPDQVRTTFQSKFGREKWLTPATDATLEELPNEGIKKLAVITPGFAADCVETLEEIDKEGRNTFIEAGGEDFTFIPCLNDSVEGVDMLETLILEMLGADARNNTKAA